MWTDWLETPSYAFHCSLHTTQPTIQALPMDTFLYTKFVLISVFVFSSLNLFKFPCAGAVTCANSSRILYWIWKWWIGRTSCTHVYTYRLTVYLSISHVRLSLNQSRVPAQGSRRRNVWTLAQRMVRIPLYRDADKSLVLPLKTTQSVLVQVSNKTYCYFKCNNHIHGCW